MEGLLMLRTVGRWLLIAVLVVTIYKACGGDLTLALNTAYSAFMTVVNSVSDWLLTLPAVHNLFAG